MLKYKGQRVIPGIPGRDLTDDEVKQYGGEDWLIKTGLYEKPAPKKKSSSKDKGS